MPNPALFFFYLFRCVWAFLAHLPKEYIENFGGSKTVLFNFSVKICFEEHGQRSMTAKYWLAILYTVVLSQISALHIIQFLLHKAYTLYTLYTDSLFFIFLMSSPLGETELLASDILKWLLKTLKMGIFGKMKSL